jgi:Ras-related protein Rap-1B
MNQVHGREVRLKLRPSRCEAKADFKTANVDEVFIDLCRQMLRRDSSPDESREDDYAVKHDDHQHTSKRSKRKKRRDDSRCIIL